MRRSPEGARRPEGSIETGKLADLIVLSQNLFEIPPNQTGKTEVILTMVGGRVVFKRHRFRNKPRPAASNDIMRYKRIAVALSVAGSWSVLGTGGPDGSPESSVQAPRDRRGLARLGRQESRLYRANLGTGGYLACRRSQAYRSRPLGDGYSAVAGEGSVTFLYTGYRRDSHDVIIGA